MMRTVRFAKPEIASSITQVTRLAATDAPIVGMSPPGLIRAPGLESSLLPDDTGWGVPSGQPLLEKKRAGRLAPPGDIDEGAGGNEKGGPSHNLDHREGLVRFLGRRDH